MEQQKEIKFFGNPTTGHLDSDSADFSLPPDSWVNMENCRTGTTDNGVVNTVESVGSATLLSAPLPSITFLQLGSEPDDANNRLIYFLYNTHGNDHKIVSYDTIANVFYNVLLSSQVTGGLNFNKDYPIHSVRIVNGMLYWVEGVNNQPRKLNIDAGIKANSPSFDTDVTPYAFPIDPTEITIIKKPPPLAPNIQKNTDAGFENNFIANDSFEFVYQFVWYDNETTVVGTYSNSSRLNKVTDTFNMVTVTMDSREAIPSSVKIVNLIVRVGDPSSDGGNNAFVIKTWDKELASDAIDISNQNSGTSQLTFDFYNNITGEAIPTDLVLKPFDSVPIYSGALEAAKNRIFLANNVAGYDTPLSTSLSTTLNPIDINGGVITKDLVSVEILFSETIPPTIASYSSWYFYLTEVSPIGYYEITSTAQYSSGAVPPLPPAPTTIAFSGLNFRGATQADVIAYVLSNSGGIDPDITIPNFNFTSNACEITGITVTTLDVFKSRSQYKIGVVFYDFALRKCGVVTTDGLIFETPSRSFDYSTGISGVSWTLSNLNAISEIPEWAYYYAVVRTLNLTTRFFIQSFDTAAKYATKDADGLYEFTNDTFVTGSVGIGLNTTALIQSGLGYTFNQGDVAVLIDDSDNIYILPVEGQSGNYIIVKAQDIGDLSTKEFVYEIYTPYQTSSQEPFYEVGEMYRILNPGTDSRQYETLSDTFLPDAYVLTRNFDVATYFAEAMSPNDLFFQRWDNDSGKPNFITRLGQIEKDNFLSWSNTYIPGTSVNGLSTFEALNQTDVPQECGAIQKIILTAKVQSEGTVMLGICSKETVSIYLGETQITDSTGQTQFFASSSGVIGTINDLKKSYGTMNPESAVEFRGNVFWVDVANGKVIQYSANGLFAISDYKMTRFWKQFCDLYLVTPAATIENLGGRPFIFTTVDPHHMELLISIPKLSATPPKGYLPDYPETIYPFDIWDATGKSIVFKLENGSQPPHWQGSYAFNPEGFVTLDNDLYAFKNGQLYKHNSQTSFNNFYGVQYRSKIMFVSNMQPKVPKVYNAISIEANMVPLLTYVYADSPYQQSSDLVDNDYRNLEGVYYSTFFRNKLVPTASGYTTDGLLVGEKVRTAALKVMLEFLVTTTPVELRFVNILFSTSLGHKTT